MSLAVGTRIGHYEIVAHLGAGAMGEVYRGGAETEHWLNGFNCSSTKCEPAA